MPKGFSNPAIATYLPRVQQIGAEHPFDATVLKDLADLQSLSIRTDNLKPNLFPDLPQIQSLSVRMGKLNADFNTLKHFPNLTSLSIPTREIRANTFPEIAILKNLEDLAFGSNGPLKGNVDLNLTPIANLSSLKAIGINVDTATWVDLSPLGELSSLTELRIDGAKNPDLSPLANCDQLSLIEISLPDGSDPLDLSPLAEMKALKTINLTVNQFPDTSPIAHCDQLEQVTLRVNSVQSLASLAKNDWAIDVAAWLELPNLKEITFSLELLPPLGVKLPKSCTEFHGGDPYGAHDLSKSYEYVRADGSRIIIRFSEH